MNAKQWKPGDVAIVTNPEGVKWRAIVRPRKAANGALELAYVTGGYDMVGDLAEGYQVRPIVVIDPEDREQVERLRNLTLSCLRDYIGDYQTDGFTDADLANAMQAALRSLIEPPKPERPTGLGAVIEDADGERWVQFDAKTGAWWRNSEGRHSRYADIDAVRVLSEGVAS